MLPGDRRSCPQQTKHTLTVPLPSHFTLAQSRFFLYDPSVFSECAPFFHCLREIEAPGDVLLGRGFPLFLVPGRLPLQAPHVEWSSFFHFGRAVFPRYTKRCIAPARAPNRTKPLCSEEKSATQSLPPLLFFFFALWAFARPPCLKRGGVFYQREPRPPRLPPHFLSIQFQRDWA